MKLRQKIYDSSESINRLIKITNSFHHYNNLKKIRERKPLYHNINNYNNKRNKKSSNSDWYINNNYIYNTKDNEIIINSIDKMKYNGYFNNKNFGIIKEKGIKSRKKNYNTSENNKNNGYSKHKNNKKKLFLPPISKYNK